MVVIAILGLLVVVGFPYLQGYLNNAKITKTQMNLQKLRETIKLYQINSANNRETSDSMRLDNGTKMFTLSDLVKYKYIGSSNVFITGWGEPFSIKRTRNNIDNNIYSLFAVYNIYINDIKVEKEAFLAIQE
ncbi:MAG: hypothetical protein C0601_11645 [Candidatus Muiribacterium halophilum]|uniref:Type II secretion system protein GspG C-terminal domain-containing protein n=1 Tax=Muiribacterium halophilum TaxID=2053465 RepID=A0A2N5ZBF8_MUIH1|nr:MAG: hypothetical protein C0601_11645 [Candidatus Muirbacterium halophilum]